MGKTGLPVKVGDSKGAFRFNAVCAAEETGLFASDVLSTFAKSTIPFVIPPTVPVKVGLLIGAFKANQFVTSVVFALSAKPGTVGAAAVPPKSPANCNLPLVTTSASEIVAEAI